MQREVLAIIIIIKLNIIKKNVLCKKISIVNEIMIENFESMIV